MGVDFTAIIDHRFVGHDLLALPERLNPSWELPPSLAPWVARHVLAGPTQWDWDRDNRFTGVAEELRMERRLRLEGPDGFAATVFEHGIRVWHLARWWSFLYEPDVQVGLQAACRAVAFTLSAQHILYLPDSSFPPSCASDALYEGGTVSQALAWLRSAVGSPFPAVGAFIGRDEEPWDERGWFYESLAG